MADTGAKTQSSDKTNPLSVSEMTPLYPGAKSLAGFTLAQHKAKGPRKREAACGAAALEDENDFFSSKKSN